MKNGQESQKIERIDTVLERLDQLEIAHNLFDYQIDGWCVWPLLKAAVASYLAPIKRKKRGESFSKSERRMLIVQDILRLLIPQRAVKYVVVTNSSSLAEQEGGFFKDFRIDDFLQDTGKYYKIENINNRIFLKNSHRALIKRDLSIFIISNLAYHLRKSSILLGIEKKTPPQVIVHKELPSLQHQIFQSSSYYHIENLAQEIITILRTEERLHHISFSYVKTVLQGFFWTKKVYTWLLRYLRPDFVLVPNISHFALVAAAKECRIKTIELQHGFVASRSHVSYSWGEHVVKYKSRLPLADRFFVYGTYWKEQLMQKGFWQEEELRIIGSFRIDNYRSIKQQRVKSDNMCTIVWTSQDVHTQDVIDFMAKFVALAHNQVKFRLIVKLHPALETNRTPYEAGLQPDEHIQIYLGNEEPTTFELLTQADMHISISSTCHYEALALGVPTIILPFSTHEKVLHLYEDEHALLVRTPQELLDSVMHWKNYKVSSEISNSYFEPDALTNMKREMGLIA